VGVGGSLSAEVESDLKADHQPSAEGHDGLLYSSSLDSVLLINRDNFMLI